MKRTLLLLLIPTSALGLNFGAIFVRSTPAILPSGKASLTVLGPYHVTWQLLNETGCTPLYRTGKTITVGRGFYDVDFHGAGSPGNRYVTLVAGTRTVIQIK